MESEDGHNVGKSDMETTYERRPRYHEGIRQLVQKGDGFTEILSVKCIEGNLILVGAEPGKVYLRDKVLDPEAAHWLGVLLIELAHLADTAERERTP